MGISPSAKKFVQGAVLGVVLLTVLSVVALYGLTWYCYLFVRTASIGYEGPIIWAAKELAGGGNIYPLASLTSQPWITILYPPLYVMLAAIGVPLAGISYLPARLVSCASSLLAAVCLYRLLRLQDCSMMIALIATAFYFSFGCVLTMSGQCRPDMLCLGIGALANYLFVLQVKKAANNEVLPKAMVWPAVLCALSCFAKQQGIVFAIAIVLALLTERKLKAASLFASMWAGLLALLVVPVQLVSGGLFANLSLLSGVKSHLDILITNLISVGLDIFKLVLCQILAPIGILMNKKTTVDERLPLILFFVCAVILAYTMGIPASNINHLIPALFALCWFIALTLRKLPEPVCLIVAASIGLTLWAGFREQTAMMEMQSRVRQDTAELIALNLKGKTVLTDDVYLNLVTDSKPAFVDCATFMNLWKDSGEGFEKLNSRIAAHEYAAILINEPDAKEGGGKNFWPPEVISTIKQYYAEKKLLFCGPWILVLFLPKSDAPKSVSAE